MKSVRSRHYYIRLTEPLPAAQWFAAVKTMKAWGKQQGCVVDEFGDCHESDREAIMQNGESDEFEGLLVWEGSITEVDLCAFFADMNLAVEQCEID